MVGGGRILLGYAVLTPISAVLAAGGGGGGGPLGVLLALGFVPALTIVLTS